MAIAVRAPRSAPKLIFRQNNKFSLNNIQSCYVFSRELAKKLWYALYAMNIIQTTSCFGLDVCVFLSLHSFTTKKVHLIAITP